MRGFWLVLILLASVCEATASSDHIILRHLSLSPHETLLNQRNSAPPDVVISGANFTNLEKQVQEVVRLLGDKSEWQDLGPDASFVMMEIDFRGKRYMLRSWYPIYRNNPLVGVSETRGLVSVSGPDEKARVERANSVRYKTITELFNLIQNVSRQQPRGH